MPLCADETAVVDDQATDVRDEITDAEHRPLGRGVESCRRCPHRDVQRCAAVDSSPAAVGAERRRLASSSQNISAPNRNSSAHSPMFRRLVLGGAFLVLADLGARVLFRVFHTEPPVGVITALLGGPAFLALLLRRARTQSV